MSATQDPAVRALAGRLRRARALLIDLDDTLYAYDPPERSARAAVVTAVASHLVLPADAIEQRFLAARELVKRRLGATASAHSRLLYLHELAHVVGPRTSLGCVRVWEELYWSTFLASAELRDGALQLLRAFRERGGKVAIVTDLTLSIQLRKLEHFSLLDSVDAVVASEEVERDKPDLAIFCLALERLGAKAEEAVVVGDSVDKDGGGARALGVPFIRIRHARGPEGHTLAELVDWLEERA